nr:hypothetical protein [candidate division Zixibacteria bacterium]
MRTANTKYFDYDLILKEPVPFEMDLPWEDYGFSRRFYQIVHDWGIPTGEEIEFLDSFLTDQNNCVLDLACGGGRHTLGAWPPADIR